MEKKLSITIKNLETGETLVDKETNAIIGAYDNADEQCIGTMFFTSCSNLDVIELLVTMEKVIKKAWKNDPKLLFARLFLDTQAAEREAEEGGETE